VTYIKGKLKILIMAKYKLILRGYGIDGSAHVLTSEEVQKIRDFQIEGDYESLADLYSELPLILENYDYSATNYWVTSTALANPSLRFVLIDENGETVWEVKSDELSEDWEENPGFKYPENIHDHVKEIDAYPHDEKPNILLVYEEVKGTLINFTIESDDLPKPSELALTVQSLETPGNEFELVSKVFFRGGELEREYDEEQYFIKSTNVEVYTMDDL
jgi:hypothetical protein